MTVAKLKAKIGTIALGAKNVKVVLEISRKEFFRNSDFFGGEMEEVDVTLGDLQASMEDYGIRAAPGFKTYQADSHGVVQNLDKGGQDADDMFDESSEQESEETETEETESDPAQEDFELDYDETEQTEEEETESQDSDEDPAPEVQGKDELENFILSGNAPSYDDLPFDFPTLLKEKRSGKTWVEVASSIGLGSGQLSAKWNEYKNRVKAYMNGEEHGAA